MKASAILALAGAAIVSAQSVDGLDDCTKKCATDLLNTSLNIDCAANDLACRCKNPNFLWGLLDCGRYCSDQTAATNWGTQQCAGIDVPIAGVSATDTVATPVASGTSVAVAPTAILTSTFTSVISSGTAVETVVGTTTISGVNNIAESSSAAATTSTTTATSALVSTVTSGSSTFVTTTGSSTFTTEVVSTSTDEGAESTAASSSSSAMGARETAAGFILAAGLAAALL